MRLRWALTCAIIILRGPFGNRPQVHVCAVAVTCMQRHEHWCMMCANLVADCKTHICNVRWRRGQFMRQAGKEEGRVVLLLFVIVCW